MNRIFRRTIDKYLELSSQEGLDDIIQWVESFEKFAETDEQISFIEGFRTFIGKVEGAYSEFEQVIDDRDNSIKINEEENTRLFETIKKEADQQRDVLEKLSRILHNVDISNLPKNRSINKLDPFVSDELLKIVDQVEGLVLSHRKNIDDLNIIFQQSLLIASSNSLEYLQKSVAKSIEVLLERPSYSMIYIGTKTAFPSGKVFWDSTEHQKITLKNIQAIHHTTLEIRGNEGLLLGFLGVDLLENEQPISENQWGRITALTPVISATIEIIGFVENQTKQVRMEHDLKTAQLVQQTLIPPREVSLDKCDIHSFSESASECGGDWWNYYNFKDRDIIVLGDVTGHGTASALVTAFSRGFFDAAVVHPDTDVQDVCTRLNQNLYSLGTKDKVGMTLVCISLDYASGKGSIISAGHLSPYVITPGDPKDSEFATSVPFAVSGSILGLVDSSEITFRTATFDITEGQKIMIFSDGIIEAQNPEGAEYSLQKFERHLRRLPHNLTGSTIMKETLERYWKFMDGEKNQDDMTLVTVELKPFSSAIKKIA